MAMTPGKLIAMAERTPPFPNCDICEKETTHLISIIVVNTIEDCSGVEVCKECAAAFASDLDKCIRHMP